MGNKLTAVILQIVIIIVLTWIAAFLVPNSTRAVQIRDPNHSIMNNSRNPYSSDYSS